VTEIRPLRAYAEVALGRQRAPQHEQGPHMLLYLRAANVKDGTLDLTDVKEMNFSPAEQAIFLLRSGDVLVTEGSGSLGSVGASAVWSGEIEGRVCFQNTLLRLRPRPGTDPRFLAWWCQYAFADGVFASVATGANIFHVSAERVRALPVKYVRPASQRAIADFLDVETARIDAFLLKKRRMVKLIEERWLATIVRAIPVARADENAPTLRRSVESTIGGSWGGDKGNGEIDALCIRGTDFDTQRLGVDETSAPRRSYGSSDFRSRQLVPGDLIVEKSGGSDGQPVGRVVRWTGADKAVPTNFAARIRPASTVDDKFLTYAFRAAYERGVTRAWTKQTTGIQNLDLGGLLSERLQLPKREEQERIVAELDAASDRERALKGWLEQQMELLRERRQALITAAVTGELEIPGVHV
jgi:type I restriction enzyme S subunit